ncbi:tetratricopeptide repeat-containing glycosyltransferase family protein [Tumidithrix elongata RA019]|uniref:Tetratricopeptide repeat-containing glycosyltransferase family protein n=1 Tax=Tumidithrix elongata BACA0141 TaxID=2716417 RepID=A0AAW9PX87_9CYAN|nr:tetratricopeptide repeat-containing glycosyltransferase family protein [Tumidithrix elongata RA019]
MNSVNGQNQVEIWTESAREKEALGDYATALQIRQKIYAQVPDDIENLGALGKIHLRLNQMETAIACFQDVLTLQPDSAQNHCNLGALLALQNLLEAAIVHYQSALAINPNLAEANYNLGAALFKLEHLEAAIPYLERAIALKPNLAEAYSKLGAILFQQGNIEAAIAKHEQAIAVNPHLAEAYYNLGIALAAQRKIESAIAAYETAISIKPNFVEAHHNLALALLLIGDYQRGLVENEWRWQMQGRTAPNFSQPVWDGTYLPNTTILLWAEQGFGDVIQFIRYLPLVQKRVGKVLVQSPPPLKRLLSEAYPAIEVISTDSLLPPFDIHIPLMSLPLIFGTNLQTIPTGIPYISVSQGGKEIPQIPTNNASNLKIGIVWASSNKGDREYLKFQKYKSCPLSMFLPILGLPHIALYSLQVGCDADELQEFSQESRLYDLNPLIRDFADTARFIDRMDMVISVDTAVAHLAGAMGKKGWILLPFVPDWRWLLDREDSPWYPNMRLFRQSQPGKWEDVFEEVLAALQTV